MDTGSDGSALQRLEIRGGYYYAIQLQTERDDGRDGCGATGILIESCVIHGTGRDCIKVTPGCDDATIRFCEIYDSGLRDSSNADGIDNVDADRMTVADCYIHDTATSGLYFKGGATLCVAERLRVEDCGSFGILLGFDTSPDFFDLSVNPEWYENIDGMVRNCYVRNTRYAGIYFGVTFQDWVDEAGRPDLDRNCYFMSSGTASFHDGRPGSTYSGGLAGWKSHVGGEASSFERDPRIDETGHLRSGSPGLGKAETRIDVKVGIDYESRGSDPDFGCDER